MTSHKFVSVFFYLIILRQASLVSCTLLYYNVPSEYSSTTTLPFSVVAPAKASLMCILIFCVEKLFALDKRLEELAISFFYSWEFGSLTHARVIRIKMLNFTH